MAQPVTEIVISSPPMGESAQPEDESRAWTPQDSISPPEDLETLAKLTQVSPLRRSCIEAIVRNTVGLGVDVVPREGQEEEVENEDETKKVAATLDALARRDVRSYSPTFAKLLRRPKWDEQEVGNGYIEVSRNRLTGQIDGLFHAPGKRVRRLKDRTGWIVGPREGVSTDRVRFYNFGEKVQYDEKGNPQPRVEQGKRWNVNELIPFQLYTSESRDYGLPPDTQLAWDYAGDKNAAETNLSFFDSNGVPPTAIFVQGEVEDPQGGKAKVTVSPKTIQAIADTLRSDRGAQHRVAIIPLPPGVEANVEGLAKLSERDMGFVDFRRDNRRRTLGAWRLAPILVADIEDTNYSTAQVEKELTKEQVFDPEQADWSDVLSDTLLRELGFPHLRFKFTEMQVETPGDRQQAAEQAGNAGVITNGEYRTAHGYEPLPEAKEGEDPTPGQVPLGWNAELVKATQQQVVAAPVQDPAALAKSDLESELRSDFTASLEDAMRRVSTAVGSELELGAVVVEKEGERIVVSPYSENGSG